MKKLKWIFIVVFILIVVRAILPSLLKNRINKQLSSIDGYHGSVEDVDLALYRGGFRIHDLRLIEEQSLSDTIPLVNLEMLDFSIEWRSIFDGKFVGEVYFTDLDINFVKRAKVEEDDVKSSRAELIKEIQSFNPIHINILEVKSGSVSYKDPTTEPKISISLDSIYLKAENLRNVHQPGQKLPAHVLFKSSNADGMVSSLDADLNYLVDPPNFDIDFELENLDIVRFNEITESKAGLDMEKGTFHLFMEMHAKDGKIDGYSKPIIKNLKIAPADSSDGLIDKVYEEIVEVGTGILENNKKDQIASKIPISGTLKAQDPDVSESVWNLFKNAFVEAYTMRLDESIKALSDND